MSYEIPKIGSITFNNIAEIREHEFYGSYAFDEAAFKAIEAFVADPFETHSVADRAEAIKIMCMKGMGFTLEETTEGLDDEELVDGFFED